MRLLNRARKIHAERIMVKHSNKIYTVALKPIINVVKRKFSKHLFYFRLTKENNEKQR